MIAAAGQSLASLPLPLLPQEIQPNMAQAVFLYGRRRTSNLRSFGFEELHLFHCSSVPRSVDEALKEATGQLGFVPRRRSADYARKGAADSYAGWVWQEARAQVG